MSKRLATGILVLLSAVIVAGCKMPKSECMSTYNLMEKTKDGCISAFPTLHETISPSPAPGPKIIIKKVSGDFAWYTNTGGSDVLQGAGTSAWSTGKIRADFCGTIMDFTVDDTVPASHTNSSLVLLQSKVGNDTYNIEIWRTQNDVIRWIISKAGTRKPLTCDNTLSTTTVPSEFLGTALSFREELADVDLTDVNFLRTGTP
jgi:hypothetical protein